MSDDLIRELRLHMEDPGCEIDRDLLKRAADALERLRSERDEARAELLLKSNALEEK